MRQNNSFEVTLFQIRVSKLSASQYGSGEVSFAQDLMRLFEIPVTKVDYADLVADPENVARQIADFVPQTLDVDQMVEAIDPNLYRQRKLVNKSVD